jgi:hypothetical protein
MAKHLIAVGRLCVNGSHRQEVGNFLVEVTATALSDPEVSPLVDDVLHIPVASVPTPTARNKLVKTCQDRKADILFMVDDDCLPPEGFFKAAVQFLTSHAGPAVIAVPYCCGPPNEDVQVFRFVTKESHSANAGFSLEHYGREEAARLTGIERVANIGTHLIAYKMSAFDKITKPYFDYDYNAEHTRTIETEDCYCHRHLWFAGVPLYVHWDYWAGHWKAKNVVKPFILEREDIDAVYMNNVKALDT